MKRCLIYILCLMTLLGCSFRKEMVIIEKAKQTLASCDYSSVIFFTEQNSDSVHILIKTDGKNEFFYRSNDSPYYDATIQYEQQPEHIDAVKSEQESILFSNELSLLEGILESDLHFDRVINGPELTVYYYALSSDTLVKHHISNDYEICVIVDSEGGIVNIRLFAGKITQLNYYLNVICKKECQGDD